jgi:hypothetical protein
MPIPKFIPIILTEPQIKAFWARVRIGAEDECWLWTKYTNPHGYGIYVARGYNKVLLAHRVAYVIHNHAEPSAYVLHTCDTPACCNFKHLYDGTQQDNANDRERRGRGNAQRGVDASRAKLNEIQVGEIRALIKERRISLRAIANNYGVTPENIQHIKNRKSWRHLL